MNEFIKRIFGSDLIKSSFYSAVATFVKIVTAFLMSKIIAIKLGPDGMGLIGQLTNFISIVLILCGGAITNGIVKYLAEYRASAPEKIAPLMSTSFKLTIILSVLVGAGLIIFSKYLSTFVLFSPSYAFVFIVFGVTIGLYGLNNLLLSIVNGYKEYKKFNIISINTSILSLIVSLFFIYRWQVNGALIALVVNQSVVFIATLFFLRKEKWLIRGNFAQSMSRQQINNLSRFALMALVSTATVPISQMYIRAHIIHHISLEAAGIWESVNRISNIYLMFVTTSLTTYYLPKLSELSNERDVRKEVLKVYKVLMPIVIVSCAAIYLFRMLIIKILFTGQFNEASELFLFQMIGDMLKIASWILGFQLVAKAKTKLYITVEVIFSFLFVVFSLVFINKYGLIGTTYAFALNYLLCLIFMIVVFRKMLFNR
ncbi:O-antigen translocase [Chitinophaga pendula]|uniref:O-antigen translocase n=1 Tax=Chitinophaga TaxID=79328 RepID=UPI000BAEF146|nr:MULTISPECIES: O-antigen translocase [Chitinophaga]ASZ10693.1 O-antigen flippase [Chitinophaga sp. MD30]UCJ06334.1 O-antigen translocase [Chitinophaga pendula]